MFCKNFCDRNEAKFVKVGYTRVSTLDRNLDLQRQTLKKSWLQEDLSRKGLR
jgi:predicted site-specific integrase-resolvase